MNEFNLKYNVVKELPDYEDTSFLVQKKNSNDLYVFTRIWSSSTFGFDEIKTLFHNSRRTVSKHVARYVDAGQLLWINSEPVQSAGYFLVSPFFGEESLAGELNLKPGKLQTILYGVAITLRELADRQCRHGNLIPSNVIITKDNPVLINTSAWSGALKPSPIHEINKLLKCLERRGVTVGKAADKAITYLKSRTDPWQESKSFFKDLYEDPTSWILNIEHMPQRVIEGIEYSARDLQNCINVTGRWDSGLKTVIDEVIVERQLTGKCVIDITVSPESELFRLFPGTGLVQNGTREQIYNDIIDISLKHPLDLVLRVESRLEHNELKEIENFLRLISTGRITTLLISERDIPINDLYKVRLKIPPIDTMILRRRFCGSPGGEFPDFLTKDATPAEFFQIFFQNSKKVSMPVDKNRSDLFWTASALPGISLKAASAASGKIPESFIGNPELGQYLTTSLSGSRLWCRRKLPISTVMKEKITETLLYSGCTRIQEVRWLLRNSKGEDEKTSIILAEFWAEEKYRLEFEQEIPFLSEAARLFYLYDEEISRRIILDVLWNTYGKTETIKTFYDSLKPQDMPGDRMGLLMKLLNASVHKASGNTEKAVDIAFQILEEEWIPEISEELALTTILFAGSKLPEEVRKKSEIIIDKLLDWLDNQRKTDLVSSVLVTKATCFVWCDQKEKALTLLKRINPPDENTHPHTAFIFYWLMSYIEEEIEEDNLENVFNNMNRAYYIAKSNGFSSAIIGALHNRSLLANRLGNYNAAETAGEMDQIIKMSCELKDRYQLVLSCVDAMHLNLSLMNRSIVEKLLSRIDELFEILPDYLMDLLSKVLIRFFLLKGTPETAVDYLRKLEKKFTEPCISFRISFLHDILSEQNKQNGNIGEGNISSILAANLRLSRNLCSHGEWLACLRNLPEHAEETEEKLTGNLRNGSLVQAYCILVLMIARNTLSKNFMRKKKKLFEALDIRYRKAGFVLDNHGRTPLETVLRFTQHEDVADAGEGEILSGNTIRSAIELSRWIISEIGLDYLWVLKKSITGITSICSFPDSSVSHRVSWVNKAIDYADETGKPWIDITGTGWSRGDPQPGVVAVNIGERESIRHRKNSHPGYYGLFIVAENVSPGRAISRKNLRVLLNYSGILASLADYQTTEDYLKHDGLSGLLLKESWTEQCRSILANPEAKPAMLAIVDIDEFKNINDTLGHDTGDKIIKDIAGILVRSLRDIDVLGRYGGDEFVLLVQNITPESAQKILKRILGAIRSEIKISGPRTTASIGYAMVPEDAETLSLAFLCADRALYRSKSMGGNKLIRGSLPDK